MSTQYFSKFPTVAYDVLNDGVYSIVTDLSKTVDISTLDEDRLTYYTYHEIGDGERPDSLSYNLYGTTQYYWTFFVVNDTLKSGLHHSWPLNSRALETMISREYDNYSAITFDPMLHERLTDGALSRQDCLDRVCDFTAVPFDSEFLPHLRLVGENQSGNYSAQVSKYDNDTCQLVVYNIRNHVDTQVTVKDGGSGYAYGALPYVTFVERPGSIVVDPAGNEIYTPSGGVYVNPNSQEFSPALRGAKAVAVVGNDGGIDGVHLIDRGLKYNIPPRVIFDTSEAASAQLIAAGSDQVVATIKAKALGREGNNIVLVFENGSGPVSASLVDTYTIKFTGALTYSGVKAVCESNVVVKALISFVPAPGVSNPTVAWPTTPQRLATGPLPKGKVILRDDGSIDRVDITYRGSGFSLPPAVTFSPSPGGRTPSAIAIVEKNGSVSSIVVTSNGSGYDALPTVTITPPPGSGNTCIAYVSQITRRSSSRRQFLSCDSFKLHWENPYETNTLEFIANQNLRDRFVSKMCDILLPLDKYTAPGTVDESNNYEGAADVAPLYANTPEGRARYVFDRKYLRVQNQGSNVYTWDLYRDATKQYTLERRNGKEGIVESQPATFYDVKHANDGKVFTTSFAQHEEALNLAKRKIKIIKPNAIQSFSKTYFDLLNR